LGSNMQSKFLARSQLIEKCLISIIGSNTDNLDTPVFQHCRRPESIFTRVRLSIGNDHHRSKLFELAREVETGGQISSAPDNSDSHRSDLFFKGGTLHCGIAYHRGPIGEYGKPRRISVFCRRFGKVDCAVLCLGHLIPGHTSRSVDKKQHIFDQRHLGRLIFSGAL